MKTKFSIYCFIQWGQYIHSVWRAPKSLVESHLRVQLCRDAESWDLRAVLDFQRYRGVEGRARSPGIRLGRGTRLSSLNLHPKLTTKGLVHIREHPWVLGQATGTLTHLTHHSPYSREAITFPHIVFPAAPRGSYTEWHIFPGLPRRSPEIVPGWTPGTLDTHNSWLRPPIGVRSQPKL